MLDGFIYCKALFNGNTEPVDYVLVDANGAFEMLTGLRRDRIIGKKLTELPLGMEKYCANWVKMFGEVAMTQQAAKLESCLYLNGKWYSISAYCPKRGYLAAMFEDVTERKNAERALQHARQDWEHTFDSVPDFIAILDNQHRIIRANRPMAQQLGVTTEQCIGLSCYTCVHGTDQPPAFCPHAKTVQDGKEHIAEVHEERLGGDFLVSTTPLKDEHGQTVGSVHVARNITERKRAERELFDTLAASQRRQAEISALLKAAKAVLQHREFGQSAKAIFDSCKELLGATAGYVALLSEDGKDNVVLFLDSGGLPCSVDPSLPMPIRGLRAETYTTGKVAFDNDFSRSKWSRLLPAGHVDLGNVLFAPLTIGGRTVGLIGLANKHGGFDERDAQMAMAFGEIASIALLNSQMLKMLQENAEKIRAHSEKLEELVQERTEKLKEAERLAAIGETAGMVGHDIRNPLQSIIGELYLQKAEVEALPDSEEKRNLTESISIIEDRLTYVNKIVSDLQDFAKTSVPILEEVNLQKIAKEALAIVNIPGNIEASYTQTEGFKPFMSDPAFLKRILTNLALNAVQAMPKGGLLEVTASQENGKVRISVSDAGEGIPEEARAKLFKPLFTTKAKGQGFGLAAVKKLTDGLNGTVTFESQQGKGTRFTIEIPIN